jgi:hypothetical protein
MEDLDVDALSCPLKANYIEVSMDEGVYVNHFQVNDCNTKGMVSFDVGWHQYLANNKPTWGMVMQW